MRLINCYLLAGCTLLTSVAQAGVRQAQPENLQLFVSQILGPMQYPRHGKYPDELHRTAAWLNEQMRLFSIPCQYQNVHLNHKQYRNVVCSLNVGRPDKVILGAHYDTKLDSHGINDNASGVAAVLEAAHILRQRKTNLKHNVDFVFYSLATPPYHQTEAMGSLRHAKSLSSVKDSIHGVYVFDQIGFYDADSVQDYPAGLQWIYPSHGNFIAAVSNLKSRQLAQNYCQAMQNLGQLQCERFSLPLVHVFEDSDHQSYWHYDLPAVLITDTGQYRNKNHYRAELELKRLDYTKMAAVVDGVVASLDAEP